MGRPVSLWRAFTVNSMQYSRRRNNSEWKSFRQATNDAYVFDVFIRFDRAKTELHSFAGRAEIKQWYSEWIMIYYWANNVINLHWNRLKLRNYRKPFIEFVCRDAFDVVFCKRFALFTPPNPNDTTEKSPSQREQCVLCFFLNANGLCHSNRDLSSQCDAVSFEMIDSMGKAIQIGCFMLAFSTDAVSHWAFLFLDSWFVLLQIC